MTEKEVWRPIPSLPGYIASSTGKLMRVPYTGAMPKGGVRVYGGDPTWGQWSDKDQRYVIVFGGKTYKVHRLICEAFNRPQPHNKPVCMHLNENPRDNRPSNLAWGTQKENMNASGFLAYCRSRVGRENPQIKGRETA